MTMITPSYLGETIEYSSLHACRSTLEDPTERAPHLPAVPDRLRSHDRPYIKKEGVATILEQITERVQPVSVWSHEFDECL